MIKQAYSEESGLYEISILVNGNWAVIASESYTDSASIIISLLKMWKDQA